jgi:DNA-binding MarR family transcriptional regulator
MAPTGHKELERALRAFKKAMTVAFVAEAKSAGCSVSYLEVMRYLAEHGEASMKDIAGHLGVTPPSATTLVEAMVGKQFLTRTHTTKDRRRIRLTLAPAAHRLLATVHSRKQSVFDSMLSKLSVKDKDELARILMKSISK